MPKPRPLKVRVTTTATSYAYYKFYNVKSTAKSPLQPKDIISYTLTVTNNSKMVQDSNFEVNISDILEYANLLDGGDYNIKDGIIYWNKSSIEPGESKSKFFAIKIKGK